MEIRYRREMRHNYLIIEPDIPPEEGYESRMMLGNKIGGLLRFHMVTVDNKACFYYEITSKQPLLRLLESRCITRIELSGLILELAATLERMEAYLLPEEQILLKPEYIYVEPESFQVSFCLLPGNNQNFPLSVGQLLQFLLGNVDHQDKESVILVYGLYQESQKENYGMEDLLRLLGRPAVELPNRRNEPEAGFPEPLKESSGWGRTSESIESKPVRKERKSTGWKSWRKNIFESRTVKKEQRESVPETWHALFEEAEEAELRTEIRKQELYQHEPTTALLAEAKEIEISYYLQAMQPGIEDIPITEFPFIIGKQSSLVDFVLEKETISRLHVKIEEEKGSYRITDLNSTNGTKVRGRSLDNNETEIICSGDEVQIAEWRYRFMIGSKG